MLRKLKQGSSKTKLKETVTKNQSNKVFSTHLPHNDNFLRTAESVLAAARWFGVSTTGGLCTMSWFILVLLLHIGMEMGTFWKILKVILGWAAYSTGSRSIMARLSGAIFYGNSLISLGLFWRLRSGWERLIQEWCMVEGTTGLVLPPDKHIRRNLIIVIGVVLISSVVEHLMSMVSIVDFNEHPREWFRDYILGSHAFLIIPSDYSITLGLNIFIVSKISTIVWNFQDLVIIMLSMGLSSRYRRLNQYVQRLSTTEILTLGHKKFDNDIGSEEFLRVLTWRRIREAFVRQAALVRRVDVELGALVLLSTASNFYFICLQIFNGIGGERIQILDKTYFFVSMGWLIARACAVVLAGADVNVLSRDALRYLHECPDIAYNVEIQRLEKQFGEDFVALSGMGFFYLKRSMLLDIVAAVIKYELVLLEFDR